jgi:hypothetical protein
MSILSGEFFLVTEATAARDAILRPVLQTMRDPTYREIAEELTNRGIKTPRGGDVWNQVTVMRDEATGHCEQVKASALEWPS